jgi:hypothetical protein
MNSDDTPRLADTKPVTGSIKHRIKPVLLWHDPEHNQSMTQVSLQAIEPVIARPNHSCRFDSILGADRNRHDFVGSSPFHELVMLSPRSSSLEFIVIITGIDHLPHQCFTRSNDEGSIRSQELFLWSCFGQILASSGHYHLQHHHTLVKHVKSQLKAVNNERQNRYCSYCQGKHGFRTVSIQLEQESNP